MYHQTGSYDAGASREAQHRLQGFSGATAISSKCVAFRSFFVSLPSSLTISYSTSQYFGREDEEGDLEESIMSANGLGGLETSARDAVRQVMDAAGIEDLTDVQNALRNGAMKVRLFPLLPSSSKLTGLLSSAERHACSLRMSCAYPSHLLFVYAIAVPVCNLEVVVRFPCIPPREKPARSLSKHVLLL
jgi:hypothetical protein